MINPLFGSFLMRFSSVDLFSPDDTKVSFLYLQYSGHLLLSPTYFVVR